MSFVTDLDSSLDINTYYDDCFDPNVNIQCGGPSIEIRKVKTGDPSSYVALSSDKVNSVLRESCVGSACPLRDTFMRAFDLDRSLKAQCNNFRPTSTSTTVECAERMFLKDDILRQDRFEYGVKVISRK